MKRIGEFMKRNYKVILFITALSAVLWSFIPNKKVEDPEKDKLLLDLMTFVLEKVHYSPISFDDDFSKQVYDKYLEGIDPTKRFFIQSDIAEFSKYELQIDDMIRNKELTFFTLTHTRLLKRMEESRAIYKDILSKPFDFEQMESINVAYEKLPFAQNKKELVERWRKQLKLQALSSVTDKQKLEEEKKKTDPSYQVKSFAVIEKEVRESSLKSLNEYFDFIQSELDRADWFSMFLNSIVERFDPHTFYFSPEDKEKFDVSMSGTFQGIGARLQKKESGVEVSELISGGPAWKGKQLEAGDLILKVGQGKENPIDIAGMRLDDVVKKIKGPKGTEVRLTVKKVDGSIQVISIIRDEVETEETFAKSSIVEKDGKKFGIIYLPKFYISFENKQNRDAFKDVAMEIERLKAQNIDGIVMDLRDNGGGSLETVVKMVGLFIPEGPVVQVKAPGRNPEVLPDLDKKVQYDGPLVVMINNFSASASEIFAAAIQDYNRGIVVGSKHSYGKGTVQNVIDLNQFIKGNEFGDLGALKTTIQKFYRINGGSTQREGVKSDIVFPDRFTYLDMGERDEESALPWDRIAPVKFEPLFGDFKDVIDNSRKRIASNSIFTLIDQNAKWIYERKDQNVYSLNINEFKEKERLDENKLKRFKPISEYNNNLTFSSLPYEIELFDKDPVLKEKRDRWHEDLQKDIYITETLNVISEMKSLNKAKLATSRYNSKYRN
ncbi:carboxy terminal-processing peptidase [Flavobacterium cucumis]|uniref:Carboxyl-terminal processing protease n=1 Tax=Flavobacterium cucumis TaxID=416016 RepID=A0A1M7ZV84_9FLAO|nr:carboxy terminal-processing peptidase [Flavobacterium cucumis]SHO72766.1 carboxyl-terminal processing protease [Flavobacterium cucumis]